MVGGDSLNADMVEDELPSPHIDSSSSSDGFNSAFPDERDGVVDLNDSSSSHSIDDHSIFGSSTDSLYDAQPEATGRRTAAERKEWSVRFAEGPDTRPAAMRAARGRGRGRATPQEETSMGSPIPDETGDLLAGGDDLSPGVARPQSQGRALQSRGGSRGGSRGASRGDMGLGGGYGLSPTGDNDESDDSFFVQEDWGAHDAVLDSPRGIEEETMTEEGVSQDYGKESFDDMDSSPYPEPPRSAGAATHVQSATVRVRSGDGKQSSEHSDNERSPGKQQQQPRRAKTAIGIQRSGTTKRRPVSSSPQTASPAYGARPSTRRRVAGGGCKSGQASSSIRAGRRKAVQPLPASLANSPFAANVNLGAYLVRPGDSRLLAPARYTPNGDPFHDKDSTASPSHSHASHTAQQRGHGAGSSAVRIPAGFVYDAQEHALLLSNVLHERDAQLLVLKQERSQLRVSAKSRENRLRVARRVDLAARAEQLRSEITAARALLLKARTSLAQEQAEHDKLKTKIGDADVKQKRNKFLREMKKKMKDQNKANTASREAFAEDHRRTDTQSQQGGDDGTDDVPLPAESPEQAMRPGSRASQRPASRQQPRPGTREATGKAAILQGRLAVQKLKEDLDAMKASKQSDANKAQREMASQQKRLKKLAATKDALGAEIRQNDLAVRALLGHGYKGRV